MAQYATQILLNHLLNNGKNKEGKKAIVLALGYKNLNKGYRRLEKSMFTGYLDTGLINKLPEIFGIDKKISDLAIRSTQRQLQEEEKIAKEISELIDRLNFKPHLWRKHASKIPHPIFLVAFCGIYFFKYVKLPEDITFRPVFEQLEIIDETIKTDLEINKSHKPFGETTGYYYRKTYDETFEFSTDGKMIGKFGGTIDTKEATLSYKGREIGGFIRKNVIIRKD